MRGLEFNAALILAAALTCATNATARERLEEGAPVDAPSLDTHGDLTPFLGQIISRVVVVVDGEPKTEESVHGLRAGDTLSVARAREGLQDLLASGRYARGAILAARDAAGVVLTFRLVPRRIVGGVEVDLHGASVDADALLTAVDLRKERELVPADVHEIVARIERLLARDGYPEAKVHFAFRGTDDPLRVLVSLDVVPGPASQIASLRFEWTGPTDDKARSIARSYAVKAHARVEADKLDKADRQLEEVLHGERYVRAIVSHRIDSSPRGSVLVVVVDAGGLTDIRFHGNRRFDDARLLEALDIPSDPDRTAPHWAERLRKYYASRGYYDVQVTPEAVPNARGVGQTLLFQVAEHRRVRIAARHYPCLPVSEIAHLSEGGPTSAKQIDAEINSYMEEELPGSEFFSHLTGGLIRGLITDEAMPLDPDSTFVAETFNHGVAHIQDLYRSEGYLNAVVGPMQIARKRCDPSSPPGGCTPVPSPEPAFECKYDATGQPLGAVWSPPPTACIPSAEQNVSCASDIELYVPVELGPRTRLYDVAFSGVKSFSEVHLLELADLPMGTPVSSVALEQARKHIVDAYKEEGYFYADVAFTIEPSLNHTRARVRFEVSEGPRVLVDAIVIRGEENVSEETIRKRVVLAIGGPYRASLVRRTQELLGMLGVFTTVTVGLDSADVHEAHKTVFVRVAESLQDVELRGGVSTGEGFRLGFDYQNPNLGSAVSLNFRSAGSYLPKAEPFLTPSSPLWAQYDSIPKVQLFVRRITLSLGFPDIGLGPEWRAQIEGIHVQDLEPDFGITKETLGATLSYRPSRHVFVSFGADMEVNDADLFGIDNNNNNNESIATFLATQGSEEPALARLLRFPDGTSWALAQRAQIAWDLRDNLFNPHRGTYLALAAEFVQWCHMSTCSDQNGTTSNRGYFVRLTQGFTGHIPFGRSVTLAGSIRFGENVQLVSNANSTTYTDRLFFLGGADSNRGWSLESIIPQDVRDSLAASKAIPNPLTVTTTPIGARGGNLMVNPRAELRFPVYPPLDGVLFIDAGNIWSDPRYPFSHGVPLRTSVGTGIRAQTPIGPLAFDLGFKTVRGSILEDPSWLQFSFSVGVY